MEGIPECDGEVCPPPGAASFSGGCYNKYKDVPEGYVYTRPKKNIAFLNHKGLKKVSICFVIQKLDSPCPEQQERHLHALCPRHDVPQRADKGIHSGTGFSSISDVPQTWDGSPTQSPSLWTVAVPEP